MKLQKLLSYTRKAVDAYSMIQSGDKIAVGVSGGKDSLALLYALNGLKRFYPNKFEIVAISVSLGFEDFSLEPISKLCKEMNIDYYIVETDIANVVFEERKEKNPCSLCSKMRKGALNQKALELGINKIAYGHHKEDLINTMLMSLFFEGRINTFSPVTYLDRTDLTMIRPLLFVPEREIIGFTNLYNTPVVKSLCPANGNTKREEMSLLLKELNLKYENVSDRMFKAIIESDINGYKNGYKNIE